MPQYTKNITSHTYGTAFTEQNQIQYCVSDVFKFIAMQLQIQNIINQIAQVIVGKPVQIKMALTCLFSNGHLLIEDLPGMGKTTLSQTLAQVLGLQFNRVQFTSDLLPADILGVNIYDTNKQSFVFHQGPVFANILLADEINRSNPKTQSALLEAMAEKQVTIDGVTHSLPDPFIVIATQNPIQHTGTYALPESQLDRFFMRIQLGYPDWHAEKQMLLQNIGGNTSQTPQIISAGELLSIQKDVVKIRASGAIIDYILKLVTLSRENDEFPNPLSPRASKAILLASKAWAYVHDRDFVIPEDVQDILPCLAEHRMRSALADFRAEHSLTKRLLEQVDPINT